MKESLALLKVGTNSIQTARGYIRKNLLEDVAASIYIAQTQKCRSIIVTSGAIARGKKISKKLLGSQIYAGIGQPSLIIDWQEALAKYGLVGAQFLYVNQNLRKKSHLQSTMKALNECLRDGVVPIVNENDLLTDAETKDLEGFGDNDQLASLLATIQKANYLFLLTTVDGVISPETGIVIPHLSANERKIEKQLQVWPGDSKGGMRSKVKSAKSFVRSVKGARAFIASYKESNIIFRATIAGENIGTEIS